MSHAKHNRELTNR